MQSVRAASLGEVHKRGFTLQCAGQGVTCAVSAVDAHVTRVLLTRHQDELYDRTWAVLPGPGVADVPPAGRSRSDMAGWPPLAALHVDATSPTSVVLHTGVVTVTAALSPSLSLSWADSATGKLFCQDRASRAYALATTSFGAVAHSQRRAAGEQYYGLGDKTGPLNLAGRRLRADSVDALGADAERGDPLYKAWPLLIVRCSEHATFAGVSPTAGVESSGSSAPPLVYGIFYDTQCASTFDLGAENSNYHGPYRSFEGGGGALDIYHIYGPTLADVTRRFLALTGRPPLPPRWVLGYGLTAMPLADAPDAPARISSFVAVARAEGVPISSWHFGSGYTLHNGQRMTFEWNKQKFPYPEALTDQLRSKYHLAVVANAKPCLLAAHARFGEAAAAGALVMEREPGQDREAPAMALFWDGDGAHIDFMKPAGQAWWAQRATQALLSRGIDVIWNDNNEYELHEPNVHAGDAGVPLAFVRCGMPLVMARTSLEATQAACPLRRAYTITRAGCPGVQRYASTWGGDNASTWESLRWGIRTALQLSISGFGFTGFDIGGFSGPPPEPELLVRAFQAALPWHRFVTNSWKACGSVNSPWLFPDMLPQCRAAVLLRYRLMPYLYTLAHVACSAGDPPCTPTFYHFGADPTTWRETDDLLLGPSLLCAPVVTPRARHREVYLPSGPPCWFDFASEQQLPAGCTVTVAAPLEQMPMFCPAGAMVPLTQPLPEASLQRMPHEEPSRVVRVFPFPASGTSTFTMVEDDGISPAGAGGRADVHFALTCTPESIDLAVNVAHHPGGEGAYALPYTSITVALPVAERRKVTLRGDGVGMTRGRYVQA